MQFKNDINYSSNQNKNVWVSTSTLRESCVPPFVSFMYFRVHRYFKNLLWLEDILSLIVSGVSERAIDLAGWVGESGSGQRSITWACLSFPFLLMPWLLRWEPGGWGTLYEGGAHVPMCSPGWPQRWDGQFQPLSAQVTDLYRNPQPDGRTYTRVWKCDCWWRLCNFEQVT